MKTVKTLKGTELPLISLKGKDYLMVAYRMQWLSEDVERYDITTELVQITDEQTVARASVVLYNKDGHVIRRAQATKRETKKDFADHTEKAETAAIGRALAMLGFGTQHALADLDEGSRLADSPLQAISKTKDTTITLENSEDSVRSTDGTTYTAPTTVILPEVPKSRTMFRKSTSIKAEVSPSESVSKNTEVLKKSSNGSLNF